MRIIISWEVPKSPALALLPQPLADRLGGSLVGDSLATYVRTVHQILTPAQREVWERSFSQNR